MKANEFIKKYGIDRAKKLLSITNKMNMSGLVFASLKDGESLDFEVDELKRLIESHDFVENYGGLHCAKHSLKLFISSIAMGLYHGVDGANAEMEIPKLKQAIADVESCQ